MRFAILGRTGWLLDIARHCVAAGHICVAVLTAKERPEYRATVDDYRKAAEQLNATFHVLRPREFKSIESVLAGAAPSIVLSLNWPAILPARLLDVGRFGIVNFHLGDLPRYRGNACPNWAILRGEAQVALCAHRMAEALDAGDILVKRFLDMRENTYIGDVYTWAEHVLPSIAVELLAGLEEGALVPEAQDQDPAAALRCYPRRPEDGRIDWSQTAVSIQRQVRASSRPLTGAFTTLEGNCRLTVWRAAVAREPSLFLAVPGQVMRSHHGDPIIACGTDTLRLEEVELDGSADPKHDILANLRARLI